MNGSGAPRHTGIVPWLVLCVLAWTPGWVGAQSTASDPAPPSPAHAAGRCGESVLLGTKAQIASSPRANEEAERLALRSTEELVAPQAQYARILADLAAIRAAHPKPGARRLFGHFGTHTLIIELPPALIAKAVKGEYRGLDCLNQWYGGRITNAMGAVQMIFVGFPALYHPRRIVEAYRDHPDVLLVEAASVAADGDDITLCTGPDGGVHRYLFRHGDGNCLNGCQTVRYRGYDVTPEGAVTPLPPWTARHKGQPKDPQPSWVQPGCFHKRSSAYYISPKRPRD